jgi:hypothetical protein
MGETQDAIRRINRAVELSPRDRNAHDYYSTLCVAHYVGGDYATAAHWGLKAIAEPAHLRAGLRWTAGSLAAAGDLGGVDKAAKGDSPDTARRDSKVTSVLEVSFGPGSVEGHVPSRGVATAC